VEERRHPAWPKGERPAERTCSLSRLAPTGNQEAVKEVALRNFRVQGEGLGQVVTGLVEAPQPVEDDSQVMVEPMADGGVAAAGFHPLEARPAALGRLDQPTLVEELAQDADARARSGAGRPDPSACAPAGLADRDPNTAGKLRARFAGTR
jgi:hypothetical protein